jgi:hypothetical protein
MDPEAGIAVSGDDTKDKPWPNSDPGDGTEATMSGAHKDALKR